MGLGFRSQAVVVRHDYRPDHRPAADAVGHSLVQSSRCATIGYRSCAAGVRFPALAGNGRRPRILLHGSRHRLMVGSGRSKVFGLWGPAGEAASRPRGLGRPRLGWGQ
jgi:hypothetical protein